MRSAQLGMIVALSTIGCACAAKADDATTRAATTVDVIAARRLTHDARDVLGGPDQPGRAGRLVALARFALRLVPDDPTANYLLANALSAEPDQARTAAQATEKYLERFPDDYEQGLRWIHLNLASRQTADERLAWLDQALHAAKPAAIRAEILLAKAELLLGRGRSDLAEVLLSHATRLDPYHVDAMHMRWSLRRDISDLDRAQGLLYLLRASAGDVEPSLEMARLCRSVGLFDEAMIFYEHLWSLACSGQQGRNDPAVPYDLAIEICDAMIDAGQARAAAERFTPLTVRFRGSVDLHILLAEAWRLADEHARAEEQIKAVQAIHEPAIQAGLVSPTMARQLAMFHLLVRPDAQKALHHASQAKLEGTEDPLTLRILGMAEIVSDDRIRARVGMGRLENYADRDVYAAAFLAEYLYKTDQATRARRIIETAAKLPRGGPAGRKLQAVAEAHDLLLPTPEPARDIATEVGRMDRRFLDMAVTPRKYLALRASTTQPRYEVGETIELDVTLTNIGPLDVPMGAVGLLRGVLNVQAALGEGNERRYFDLPVVYLAAPRYLRPKQELHARVAIDVGPFGAALAQTPLSTHDVELRVHAGPVHREGPFASTWPAATARFVREDLLETFDRSDVGAWPMQYQRSLGLLVRDFRKGDFSTRLAAARRIGSLLALVRRIEQTQAAAPEPLRGQVTKPVLLAMMREVLKDRSDAVRAEMIASLRHVSLGRATADRIRYLVEDPSPLVRLRLAEVVGASGLVGMDATLRRLRADADAYVRFMAAAFDRR